MIIVLGLKSDPIDEDPVTVNVTDWNRYRYGLK